MRNRILTGAVVLALAVGAGLLFGFWLSSNAPVERAAEAPVPVAQGRPGEAPVAAVDQDTYLPEPPQPRVDGTRGVPARHVAPNVPVPLVSAVENPPPDALLSTVAPELLPPDLAPTPMAQTPTRPGPQPSSSQVATVIAQSGAEPPAVAANTNESWVVALRAELARCSTQGAVGRVVCNEQARWKYCNPDNRWGRVPECPMTGNN